MHGDPTLAPGHKSLQSRKTPQWLWANAATCYATGSRNAPRCRVVDLVLRKCVPLQFGHCEEFNNSSVGDLGKVNHIIVVMQENHSFDNYFGVLAYAPGSPYHPGAPGCQAGDHGCVDGLSCQVDSGGNLSCCGRAAGGRSVAAGFFHGS